MSATLALIRFEIERRWLAVAASLAIGVLNFLMPLVPGIFHGPPNELRGVAAGISAISYGILLALGLGGPLYANDLAEGRASFLFARPLGAAMIAAGRFGAALLIVAASTLLILLPSRLAGARFEVPTFAWEIIETPALAAGLFLLFVALLLFSSLVAIAARARTAWIILELTAVVLCGLVMSYAWRLLRSLSLEDAPRRLLLGAGIALAVAAAAAYLAAFHHGRTDFARVHRSQAITGACWFALTAFGAAVWANDFVSPSFAEVVERSYWGRSLGNDRVVILGSERGREELHTAYFYDGVSGHAQRALQRPARLSFESNWLRTAGSAAYWPSAGAGAARLERGEVGVQGFKVTSTGLELEPFPSAWAVSSDGRLFAGLRAHWHGEDNFLEVYDIFSRRLLRATRLPAFAPWKCRIEPERNGFRLIAQIEELGITSWRIEPDGAASRTAQRKLEGMDPLWLFDAERARLLYWQSQPAKEWLVLDAANLSTIAQLRPHLLDGARGTLSASVALFSDGSIGTSAKQGSRREFTLFSESGEPLASSISPGSSYAIPIGTGQGHAVLLASRANLVAAASSHATGWTVERFDMASGDRRVVARDLLPLSWTALSRSGPALLRDDEGRLFSLDADTGRVRALIKPNRD